MLFQLGNAPLSDKTVTQHLFQILFKMVPLRAFRRVFDRLSMSSEAFFVLRNHFIQTHACLCICQYVLGIGDRHLSNLMVDTTTGGIVGIDFGYSFGVSATVGYYLQ